jgi:uncharacterized protein
MLMLNIESFAGPESSTFHDIPVGLAHPAFTGWHANLDYVIFAFKWMFFEGKMRALFAMLFGASTVLLLDRVAHREGDGRAADIFHRRNMWLVALGLVHGLIVWSGDILAQYGVIALLALYPLRNIHPRKLLVAGLTIWLVGGSLGGWTLLDIKGAVARDTLVHQARHVAATGGVLSASETKALTEANAEHAQEPTRMADALEAGRRSFAASASQTRQYFVGFSGMLVTSGLIFEVAGAIITGMALLRTGFLSGELPARSYVVVAAVCYSVAPPLGLGGVWYSVRHGMSVTSVLESMFYPYVLLQMTGALGSVALLVLLFRHPTTGLASGLAKVGRMALTNYLLTSVLLRFVFSWGPWKLYGELEYYQLLYAVAAMWTINISLSLLWLRFFAFGPVEWIWRVLTYWTWQPLANSRVETHQTRS